jgi:eukaryotic-like serine/threonine-protein kinase
MDLRPVEEHLLGVVLGGRYHLRSVLARGAQGVLYRAKDTKDGDEVAVKVLSPTVDDPEAVERFFREAQAMTQLRGTAAVRVLDQLTPAQGATAIVMELLRGRDLKEELLELEEAGERMDLDRVRALFAPIVVTLEAAHAQGIVHRDLKPENIFVVHPAYGGGVRLLDFGFVRLTRNRRITRQGTVAGSPNHIAPEIWAGHEDVDHRADVYSLAVVLYRVLAGVVPFDAPTYVELARLVTRGARPSLHERRRDLPPEIDDWVEHALAADRDARFQHPRAMWNARQDALERAVTPP